MIFEEIILVEGSCGAFWKVVCALLLESQNVVTINLADGELALKQRCQRACQR